MAKTIMFQGTGSHVGKSVLTSALCRILVEDGYQVAPFKSQNMALNSYVTKAGGEIGRAQAVQAEAAKVEATVDMNPILLKPTEDITSQVIIHGRVVKNMTAQEYFNDNLFGLTAIKESLSRLKEEYQIIVIEGAGSPAEVNLRDFDLVNMRVAKLATAPVILVADIDPGGVFASIIGTFELLNEEERSRIKGIIINKFRGEVKRLKKGIDYLEKETGVPVLGVIPYFKGFKIPEEDAIPNYIQGSKDYQLEIGIISLPHISNFTDFDSLVQEPGVRVRYLKSDNKLEGLDAIILPGTKNTLEDLEYLYQSKVAEEVIKRARAGTMVIGICGGYQMLGKSIYDPFQVESKKENIDGLGLLDVITTLEQQKTTSQVKAKLLFKDIFSEEYEGVLEGYEIHMGQSKLGAESSPLLEIINQSGKESSIIDGAYNQRGNVWGTYLHGIFDNDHFRRSFINKLRANKGLAPIKSTPFNVRAEREQVYDKLAQLVRENLDMQKLYQIMGVE
ncbi:cobyric acid synthase CobQ [Orenia metallireducens]|uniref:Cobyric acid synthase n=1 Tax=Orenia metallireducens TaxID=1413210 RepID=A0A1C0A7B9_9FIRM|nr:cobyric acid synthase [Orenia metallireducens]OCL26137.1 cobyric acid synthase CobQ [Orenia metallireducens]